MEGERNKEREGQEERGGKNREEEEDRGIRRVMQHRIERMLVAGRKVERRNRGREKFEREEKGEGWRKSGGGKDREGRKGGREK